MKPLILVTPDIETLTTRRGAQKKMFVLEAYYADAVERAGGLPIVTPYCSDESLLDEWIQRCDGVLLTGGDFDVDPALFGEAPHPRLGTLKPERTAFEVGLYKRAFARGLPMLGICGGMQLMCVKRGGTLYQDLGTQFKTSSGQNNAVAHEQIPPKTKVGHQVHIVEKSLLREWTSAESLGVNSTHHQAVATLGEGLVATAHSDDGLIEAFEAEDRTSFFAGVQWHPEALADEKNDAIYKAFVDAAHRFRDRK